MFNLIAPIKDSCPYPINTHNSELLYQNSDNPENISRYLSGNFTITGEITRCPIYPVTDFARNNLFYIEGFSIFNVDKNFYTSRSFVDSFLLIYTFEGMGQLTYNEKTFSLKAGDGFFIDCRIPHAYKSDNSNWKHCVLHFQGRHTETFFHEFSQNGDVVFSSAEYTSYESDMEKLISLYETPDSYRELLISHQLENILLSLLLHSAQYKKNMQDLPENLKYLLHYMNLHYMDSLSLDFLADLIGFSKSHLIHIFKKYVGFTPREYIIQLQIESAKNMLLSSDLSANKIGQIVGIADENYFNHLFKRKVGMSPGAFRKHKS